MTVHAFAPYKSASMPRRFFSGMGYLRRGLGMWITSPRIMFLGAIPALVVGLLYTAAIVVFAFQLDNIADWITPFADGWSEPIRIATRFAAGLALIGLAVLLAVYSFVAVTLAVGDPFYERIWRTVETRMGDAPKEVDEPFWRSALRSLGTAIRLLTLTALVGIALFATGLIPVVGQIAAPVLGAMLGGWVVALELSGFAFDIRGFTLRERRRMLGARRAQTLGFGVLTYVLFLIPFGAVVIMPAAVAGATMLARDALPVGGLPGSGTRVAEESRAAEGFVSGQPASEGFGGGQPAATGLAGEQPGGGRPQ